MKEGYNVTWLPSYGAEVRGGTAHSMVHISEDPIASPTVSRPTTCIVMNKPSMDKFMGRLKNNALLIVNTSMVDNIVEKKTVKMAAFPFTRLALELGNIRVANMIAAGLFVRLKNLFPLENAIKALSKVLPSKKELIDINKKALKLGYEIH